MGLFDGIKLRNLKASLELKQYQRTVEMFEALPSFAKDDDEDQWTSLTSGKAVYTEQEVREMQAAAADIYYSNPIAQGVIETLVNFVVGRSMKIDSLDENPDVQAYWDKFSRVNKFDMRSKETCRRTWRDGECFIRFFDSSEKDGVQKIRFVDANEIKSMSAKDASKNTYGIETDPQDIEEVISYHRVFTNSAGQEMSEDIPGDEIIHVKIKVDSNVKRGVSFFVGIAPYLTKYKQWLDDRIMLNKIRTMFNLIGTPKGAGSVDDIAAKFPDTTGKTVSGGTAKKQLPKRGTALISKNIDWEYKNLKINAADTKDDGRSILLMITVGTNLAEYMVTGDASNANFASTMVSESPAVKAFEAWQDVFEKTFQEIYRKVISYGIQRGTLSETSTKTTVDFDKEKGEEVETVDDNVETNRDCQVNFPILIHRNIKEETDALAIQRGNRWVSDRTASETLGHDYDEEMKQIERTERMEKSAEDESEAHRIEHEPEEQEEE